MDLKQTETPKFFRVPTEEEFVEEALLDEANIAYYASLKTPNQDEQEVDSIETLDGYFPDSTYVNKLYLHRTSKRDSTLSEWYKLSVSPTTKTTQIELTTLAEVTEDLGDGTIVHSFRVGSSTGFRIKENNALLEDLRYGPGNTTNLPKPLQEEIMLMRSYLKILESNNITLTEDDYETYYPTFSWATNSPYIETHLGKLMVTTEASDEIESSNPSGENLSRLARDLFSGSVFDFIDRVNHKLDNGYKENSKAGSVPPTSFHSTLNNLKNLDGTLNPVEEIFSLLILYIHLQDNSAYSDSYLGFLYTEEVLDGKLIIYYREDGLNIISYDLDDEDNKFLAIDLDIDLEEISHKSLLGLHGLPASVTNILETEEFTNVEDLYKVLFFSPDLQETTLLTPDQQAEILTPQVSLSEATENENLRKRIRTRVKRVYDILDTSGSNFKKIDQYLGSMTTDKFFRELKKFLRDEQANFTLEVIPKKNQPDLQQIRDSLAAIDVPENEYVYFPHLADDKGNAIRSRYPITVGYLHIRRLQQLLSKKNSYSLDIKARNVKTGQVTSDDKVARISDLETTGLSAIGADAALKEFLGPRADDSGSKQQMYADIGTFGYSKLSDMPDNVEDKRTINTIASYLYGAGIDNDLVDDLQEE